VALYGALSPKVRCDSVHPAFLEGAMIDGIAATTSHPDGARERMTRNVSLGRLGTRAEVADLIVYLLSDECS
jgi:NAD(P)-dependent dehydrogenase (short-subunit alcohol dehydrogenase family)